MTEETKDLSYVFQMRMFTNDLDKIPRVGEKFKVIVCDTDRVAHEHVNVNVTVSNVDVSFTNPGVQWMYEANVGLTGGKINVKE